MKTKLLFILLGILGAVLFFNNAAQAGSPHISSSFPNGSVSAQGGAVLQMSSQNTQYVNSGDSRIRVWFKNNHGSVNLNNIYFCPSTDDYIEDPTNINGGDNITKINPVDYGPAYTRYGKYSCGGDERDKSINFDNISNKEPGTGYYYVDLNIVATKADVVNNYSVSTNTPGAFIGLPGSNQFNATMEQTNESPTYVDYNVPFGLPCTQQGNADLYFYLYDMDNKNTDNSGAQVGRDVVVKVAEYRKGNNNNLGNFIQYVDLNQHDGGNSKKWTPPSGSNNSISNKFNASPDNAYVLEIRDVYWNNTIQFGLGASQIYYMQCPSTATLDANAGASSGAVVGQPVRFTNSVNLSDLNRVNNDQYTYKITSSGLPPAANLGRTNKKLSNGDVVSNYNFTPTVPGEYCRTITLEPTPRPDYATYIDKSATQCVHVSRPNGASNIPINTTIEKDKPLSFQVGFYIDYGSGGCSPAGSGIITNLVGRYQIGSPVNKTIPININIGNGYCPGSIMESVALDSTQSDALNSKYPGDSVSYNTVINGVISSNASITVFEVPFTRFYGNDIYSTDSTIKFNSRTNNPTNPFNGQGSVAQYAAFALSSIVLDTAAYRSGAPVPPNGLDSPNSLLSKKSSSVYTDVKNSLPTNCPAIPSGNSFASQASGCYTLNASSHFSAADVIPVLGTGDTFGPGGATDFDNRQITIVNTTDKMFMIAGDVQTNNRGVLLIVSKGDIVIDNNVKRVDAILVTDGNIYTCGYAGYGPGRYVSQNTIDENCRVPLTINGALSAKTIDFRRVGGSRYLSNGLGDSPDGSWNCTSWKGIKNCGERGDMPFNTGKTAEIINFPAYLYWTKPFLKDESQNGAKVDAIFNAPPRL